MSHQTRTATAALLFLSVCATLGTAQDRPTLVKILTKDRQMVVGERIEHNDESIRLLDLATNREATFERANLILFKVDISENEACASVGLPAYVAWNLRHAIPQERQRTVAVLPFVDAQGRETQAGSEFSEKLITGLVKAGVRVVDRKLLDKAFVSLGVQQLSGFDPATAQRIGGQVGAQAVLSGTILKDGKVMEAHLRFIQVDRAVILFAMPYRISDIELEKLDRLLPPAIAPAPPAKKPAPGAAASPEASAPVIAFSEPVLKLRWTMNGHTDIIRALSFHPMGTLLASAGHDKTVRLWDMQTGHALQVLTDHPERTESVAFSPTGTLLASACDDGKIRFWAIPSGKLVRETDAKMDGAWNVAFGTDSNTVVSCGREKGIHLWDVRTGKLRRSHETHINPVTGLSVSPDGRTVAYGNGWWGRFEVGYTQRNAVRYTFRADGTTTCSRFTSDGKLLVSSGTGNIIRVWDLEKGRLQRELIGHAGSVLSVAISADNSVLASAGLDGTVRLWRLSTGDMLGLVHVPDRHRAVTFSSDSHLLVTAGEGKVLRVWEVDWDKLCQPIAKAGR